MDTTDKETAGRGSAKNPRRADLTVPNPFGRRPSRVYHLFAADGFTQRLSIHERGEVPVPGRTA
jgi:hypothetical protein